MQRTPDRLLSNFSMEEEQLFSAVAQQERLLLLGEFGAAADNVANLLRSGALQQHGIPALTERAAFTAVQAFLSCARYAWEP